MTQPSQKSQKTLLNKDSEVTDSLINEGVRAILTLDFLKKPIDAYDVLSLLSVKLRKVHFASFWEKMKEKLIIFDVNLTELPGTKPMTTFILVSENTDPPHLVKHLKKEERANRTLLTLVLAYILMKDEVVFEDDLFRHLKSLGIITDTVQQHDYFGDVLKKITKQFVDQLYLTRTSIEGQDNPELRWGERANLEVSKLDVLNFVCKVGYGGRMQPKDWGMQCTRE